MQDVTVGASLRNAFGEALIHFSDYPFMVFDADVAGGTGLSAFREAFPSRLVSVGIAEQAMVGIAAGYALHHKKQITFASTFASFGARAWEIFSLSVAYNRAPVCLVLSHLGLDVGPDGASAQSLSHYHLWRSIPGVRVIHPADAYEMKTSVKYLLDNPQPSVLFTGRSDTPPLGISDYNGFAKALRPWGDATIVACGHTVRIALEAADYLKDDYNLNVGVINLSTLAPLDSRILHMAAERGPIVTIEDAYGGLHELVCAAVCQWRPTLVGKVAVNDWGQSGEPAELYELYGLTVSKLSDAVLGVVEDTKLMRGL